ncbi:glycosyltransferase [Streptomyces sp. NPDC048483]|uniref:glycosyltransferase n=1 Tax=Streptomyces sp. NPDC048483 TaxID=3154927 RepID=UPI00341A00DA
MTAPVAHSYVPTGPTGGRAYLRMVQQATADLVRWNLLPDYKYQDDFGEPRGRRVRHVTRIASDLAALRDAPGIFVWDDLSLVHFTPQMLSRTIFILHHYEPLEQDFPEAEEALWQQLFALIPQCAAVVCVAPYWARFLQGRGVTGTTVIYNSFDLEEIHQARALDRDICRAEFGFGPEQLAVYGGRAGYRKGTETVARLLAGAPDLRLVTTGRQLVETADSHHNLPRDAFLRLLRVCDVGVFMPVMHEGWSRCAAEALLMDMPCLLRPRAGLGDLAALTGQPAPALDRLLDQVRERAAAPAVERRRARTILTRHSLDYFTQEWRALVRRLLT